MPVALPRISDRRADILPVVDHFIAHYNHRLNRRVKGVTPKAEALLLGYSWPGNIREMRNVIERAMILCAADRIHASALPLGGVENFTTASAGNGEQFLSLDELERLHIERIYAATEGNLSRTPEALCV